MELQKPGEPNGKSKGMERLVSEPLPKPSDQVAAFSRPSLEKVSNSMAEKQRAPTAKPSEISERTKVTLQAGAALAVIVFILAAGRYWGEFAAERTYNRAKLEEHSAHLTRLDEKFANVDKMLTEIVSGQKTQSEGVNTAVRNSTATLWAIQDLQVSLAEQGIKVKTSRGSGGG